MLSLADERAARGLTLEQTAIELGLSASSSSWISEIENGKRDASLRLALRIASWSEGRVTAASVNKELAALHGSPSAVEENATVAPDADPGAEKNPAGLSAAGAPA